MAFRTGKRFHHGIQSRVQAGRGWPRQRGNDVSEDKYLIIKAKGGFGNRMLSAVGGLVYADLTGRTAIVDWRDGSYAASGINSYPLLFESPNNLDPATLDGACNVAPPVWRGRLDDQPGTLLAEQPAWRHSDPFFYRQSCVDLTRLDRETPIAVYWSYVPKLARMRRLMAADPRFAGRHRDAVFRDYLTRWFTPKPRVLEAVDALIGPERHPVIGVHIRYTDRKTPLDRFERALQGALARMSDASVFLATDNGEVEAMFREKFPRVFTMEKWFPPEGTRIHHNHAAPDMVREAENALIDMWALSRCQCLIYSSHSTFSVTSRLLGDLPPHAVVDVDARNPVVQLKRLFQDYA